jgi:hypothetical protein
VVDGRAIFEGHTDLGSVEEVEAASAALRGEGIEAGVVIPGSQFRWPGGRVPNEIDPAMPNQQRVTDAIAHFEANTRSASCCAHRPTPRACRTLSASSTATAAPPRSVCAGVDRTSPWAPVVTPAGGSTRSGTPSDFGHEQSREDRDLFVAIQLENVTPGRQHNFNQHITDGDDVGPYDYGSIRHYERTAFRRNGRETVTPINAPTFDDRSAGGPEPWGHRRRGEHVRRNPAAGRRAAACQKAARRPTRGVFKKIRDDAPVKKRLDDPPPFK